MFYTNPYFLNTVLILYIICAVTCLLIATYLVGKEIIETLKDVVRIINEKSEK